MSQFPEPANKLIDQLSQLPGIGRKTAQRLAFYILKSDDAYIRNLSDAINDIKKNILFCDNCGIMSEENICHICKNNDRANNIICVVEQPQDIYAFEKTNSFKGEYHVIGGVLSPLDGIGPDDLNLEKLYKRVKSGMEIIIATNPSIEGDTTSLYLAKMLEKIGAKVTRLARGLPVGGDLEYMDELTLARAIEGRTEI
jgi:recombination protein RecR